MAKKFSLIIAALVALAVAVPAMASASTGLTESPSSGHVLTPVGTAISGTSTNSKVTNTKFGTLTCSKVVLLGKVTVNSESAGVEGVGTGEQTGTGCTVGSNTAEVKEIKLSNIKSPASTPGKGTASFTFTAVLPGSLVCKFVGENAPGTYTSETNVITISEAPLTVSPASCVSTTPKLSGSFSLTKTSGGASVFIM